MNEDGWSKMPKLCWLRVEDVKIPDRRLKSHFDNHVDFEKALRLMASFNLSVFSRAGTMFTGLPTAKTGLKLPGNRASL